jgi:hypothetical protein
MVDGYKTTTHPNDCRCSSKSPAPPPILPPKAVIFSITVRGERRRNRKAASIITFNHIHRYTVLHLATIVGYDLHMIRGGGIDSDNRLAASGIGQTAYRPPGIMPTTTGGKLCLPQKAVNVIRLCRLHRWLSGYREINKL